MKKILTVAAFTALAFAACGDSGSDSIPTDGEANADLFNKSWTAKATKDDRQEIIRFGDQVAGTKIVKMTKYVNCSNNRYSSVEADVEIGERAIQINQDYAGPNDDDCQARVPKGNYSYTVTPSNLVMQSTGEDKVLQEYVRKGNYSCLMDDYFGKGQTCSDYYGNGVDRNKCPTLPGSKGGRASSASCEERVSRTVLQHCRFYQKISATKTVDLVLSFYDSKVDCKRFRESYLSDFAAQIAN